MKITCNSCGAKYTIADEKVVGRRVKVRCKSCKASILVDGTGGAEGAAGDVEEEDGDAVVAAAPAASAPGAAPGATAGKKPPQRKTVKKNTWSVNLSDDDSREMTSDELVQGWRDGAVTQDAYVWKDGMDDWKPILEVPELKLRLKAVSAKAKADEVVTSSKPGAAAGSSDDLFGGVDFAGGADSEAAASPMRAGAAHDDDKKAPTGQRNESSVLFSLDALRTHEPAPKEERAAASDIFGTGASGGLGGAGLGGFGGGGLGGGIDLLTAPAKDMPPAPAGARGAVAAAPAPAPSKGKGGLIAAVLGGVLVLGGGVFFLVGGSGDADVAAEAAKTAAAEAAAKAATDAEAAKKGVENQLKKAEAEKNAMAEQLKAAQSAAEKKDEPKAEEKKDEPAAATPSTGTPSTPKPTDPKPADPKPAAPSGGGAFDTGAAKAALSAAAANTAACAQAGGPTGAGKAEVTFAPSGRVTSANVVSGPFGGTAVGGCIASTFRRAKVPAFGGAPVTVAKSFTIH